MVYQVVHGRVHRGGPWTGSTGVVHGLGPQGVVHGPGRFMFCIRPLVSCMQDGSPHVFQDSSIPIILKNKLAGGRGGGGALSE